MKRIIRLLFLSAALCGALLSSAQTTAFGDNLNVVTSAMPMLNIGPDARMGGMANAGVAASPDANALFWNPAKLAFMGAGNMQGGLSYTPWLRRLVPDVELMFANVAMGLGERSGVGASLRYFSLGDITFRNEQGDEQGTYRPYEMALDVAYALKLSENWSAGVGLRYALSDLTQGQVVGSLQTKAGQTVATDVSFYYQGEELNLPDGQKGQWLGGLNLSNIGAKVKYTESGDADFIPTNMKLGVGYNWILDRYNRVVVLFDVNKLLVPTQPVRDLLDVDGDGDRYEIIAGKDDQVPVMQGIFQSWDPGAKPDGARELMREFMYNAGVEYWYDNKFAVRGGYQHEDALKGNRRFFTMGFGLRYSLLGLDFAYLFPADQTVRSPLENTIRFSALVDLNQLLD
ncbi:MAG: type IX secretion system outer membrane channel protein PorV [Schleiferiaceae bacterium]|nr:type IX secretion system outer membrane channel protein PorV [Schleiferiaceae bacterium]